MKFVYIHGIWFSVWIVLGVEDYPFGLLTMIVSLEAIFLSTFVMISAKMPKATDALAEVAASHGVCTNLLPMRRTDVVTGQVLGAIGVPCGSTYQSKCPACADRAKRIRMQQCREGWHLDTEPDLAPDQAKDDVPPTAARVHRRRADLGSRLLGWLLSGRE